MVDEQEAIAAAEAQREADVAREAELADAVNAAPDEALAAEADVKKAQAVLRTKYDVLAGAKAAFRAHFEEIAARGD
jgi:hypothetical protein